MTHRSFTERLNETADLIECALNAIDQRGEQTDLADLLVLLGHQLLSCISLVERDPGLDAASGDLFAAATALVRDGQKAARPPARTQRLFNEARARFKARLESSRPSEHGTKIVWRHRELVTAA